MNIFQFIFSSIGRKVVMSLTGLFFCFFLLIHLYGNLFLYCNDGGITFNEWSHTLTRNLLIRIVEIVLFICILIHVVDALYITWKNYLARSKKYEICGVSQTSSFFSRNMGLMGTVIFFFVVVHMNTFFVPYRITGEVENLAMVPKEAFANGWYSLFYIIAISLLAFHLHHGFQSAFHTLGLNTKKYWTVLKVAGYVLSYGIIWRWISLIRLS